MVFYSRKRFCSTHQLYSENLGKIFSCILYYIIFITILYLVVYTTNNAGLRKRYRVTTVTTSSNRYRS